MEEQIPRAPVVAFPCSDIERVDPRVGRRQHVRLQAVERRPSQFLLELLLELLELLALEAGRNGVAIHVELGRASDTREASTALEIREPNRLLVFVTKVTGSPLRPLRGLPLACRSAQATIRSDSVIAIPAVTRPERDVTGLRPARACVFGRCSLDGTASCACWTRVTSQ